VPVTALMQLFAWQARFSSFTRLLLARPTTASNLMSVKRMLGDSQWLWFGGQWVAFRLTWSSGLPKGTRDSTIATILY